MGAMGLVTVHPKSEGDQPSFYDLSTWDGAAHIQGEAFLISRTSLETPAQNPVVDNID